VSNKTPTKILQLISQVPSNLPKPTVYHDEEDIGLDWDFEDGTNLAVELHNGKLAYSIHGPNINEYGDIVWDFKTFPEKLKQLLSLL